MNIITINLWLSNINKPKSIYDKRDLIYKLGERLNWELAKIDCFFDMYIQNPTHYTALDLLPNGVFSFEYEMRRQNYRDPL